MTGSVHRWIMSSEHAFKTVPGSSGSSQSIISSLPILSPSVFMNFWKQSFHGDAEFTATSWLGNEATRHNRRIKVFSISRRGDKRCLIFKCSVVRVGRSLAVCSSPSCIWGHCARVIALIIRRNAWIILSWITALHETRSFRKTCPGMSRKNHRQASMKTFHWIMQKLKIWVQQQWAGECRME